MSVYGEILTWSGSLPSWQQDALRRLVTQGSLSDADVDDLTAMARRQAGIADPAPTPIALSSSHLPAGGATGPTVSIEAIEDAIDVNALVHGQKMPFASDGVTAVYGDNGSGKSGYTRVLKQMCHARGSAEPVLSNVYLKAPGQPTATIRYVVDGTAHQHTWRGGVETPSELGHVAVFDNRAASALVVEPSEIVWQPGGLDLFKRLVVVLDRVKAKLELEASTASVPGPLPAPADGTTAATFLTKLSANTDLAMIDTWALSADETTELAVAETSLAAPDPQTAAKRLRDTMERFEILRTRLAEVFTAFGEVGSNELLATVNALRATQLAAKAVADEAFSSIPMPGIGGQAWLQLWSAAEAFAQAGATSDRVFPSETGTPTCVLCLQDLSPAASARLARFRHFVRADAAERERIAAATLTTLIRSRRATVVRASGDGPLLKELEERDPAVANACASFLEAVDAERAGLPDGSIPDTWAPPVISFSDPTAALDGVIDTLRGEATTLEAAADPEARANLARRRDELVGRRALYDGRATVRAEIDRLKRCAALAKAIKASGSAAVSRKGGELSNAYVTDKLVQAFRREADRLRVPVGVAFEGAGTRKGQSAQRVKLDTGAWAERDGRATVVLSEGERRAVALAAFLAELSVRSDRSALVFDDPVSSLDHHRRQLVADRIAELGGEHQVIVFTHDLVFLHMLSVAAELRGTAISVQEVRSTANGAGYSRSQPPLKATKVTAIVGMLKQEHQQLAAARRRGEDEFYGRGLPYVYGILREGWERAVEEVLLGHVVVRYDPAIQTKPLRWLHDITEADIDEVHTGMTVTSKWLPGHALSPAMNEPLPEPDELLAEVDRLDAFIASIKKRRK